MVAIKTTPSVRNKKTDIEKTLKALTTTLNALNDKLHEDKQTEIKRQKELEIQHKKDLKELKESFKNIIPGETKRNIGSTLIGGALGWSPAVVKAMGLDRLGTAIVKSTVSGIKKQLNGLFGLSENKDIAKATSAIEANKNAPVVKHLAEIKGLLKNNKKQTTVVQDEEKKQTGLLGILGGIFNSGILKLVAGLALLAGIARGVFWLARRFGWKPSGNPFTNARDATRAGRLIATSLREGKALKDTAVNTMHTGLDKEAARLNLADNVATTTHDWNTTAKELKLTPAEQAEALASKEGTRRVIERKKLNTEAAARLTKAGDAQRASGNAVKSAVNEGLFKNIQSAYQKIKQAGKGKGHIRFTKGEAEAIEFIKRSLPAIKKVGLSRVLGWAVVDAGLTEAIYHIIAWFESDPFEADLLIKEGHRSAILAPVGGLIAAGLAETFSGGLSTPALGGIYAAGASATDMGLVGPYNAIYNYNARKDAGRPIPKPDDEAGWGTALFGGPAHLMEWALYGWEQAKNGKSNPGVEYYKKIEDTFLEKAGLQNKPIEEWTTEDHLKLGGIRALNSYWNLPLNQNTAAAAMASLGYWFGKPSSSDTAATSGQWRVPMAMDALTTESTYGNPEIKEISNDLKEAKEGINRMIELYQQSIKDEEARHKIIQEKYKDYLPSTNNSFENPNANMNTPGKSDFEMIYARGAM